MADMVLVTVGDEHAPQLRLVGYQVGKIGDHQVYAVHVFVREAHAAIHYDHILAVFQDGDVFSNLIQTAQGDNF